MQQQHLTSESEIEFAHNISLFYQCYYEPPFERASNNAGRFGVVPPLTLTPTNV